MSERMTSIYLPGFAAESAWAEWGRKTPEEMIEILKQRAARDLVVTQAILDADPEDFKVATYLGPYAHDKYEILQAGKEG